MELWSFVRGFRARRQAWTRNESVVIVGLECSGKTTLFRGISQQRSGIESAVPGSSLYCIRADVPDLEATLIDTPGIRFVQDCETTNEALGELAGAKVVMLALRATHFVDELGELERECYPKLKRRKVTIVATFADRIDRAERQRIQKLSGRLGVPVVLVNGRNLTQDDREAIFEAVRDAGQLKRLPAGLRESASREPVKTLIENQWVALAIILLIFAGSIIAAYQISAYFEDCCLPWETVEEADSWSVEVFRGRFGLGTLGLKSFVWAWPVVLLIGLSTALTEELGLKERLALALDPWSMKLGMSGRDLIHVLTGYGCNVVAVVESRTCSGCTRAACVSQIAMGSACSYQIGAAIYVFESAKQIWVFPFYLLLLFVVACLNNLTRPREISKLQGIVLTRRSLLQMPRLRAVTWRLSFVFRKFLFSAGPIFLGMCVLSSTVYYYRDRLSPITQSAIGRFSGRMFQEALEVFGLPAEVGTPLLFSIVRKDGILFLGDLGALLAPGQLLVAVYLLSAISGCSVTIYWMLNEFDRKVFSELVLRQLVFALASTFVLAILVYWIPRGEPIHLAQDTLRAILGALRDHA